jgi:hypothetical protein
MKKAHDFLPRNFTTLNRTTNKFNILEQIHNSTNVFRALASIKEASQLMGVASSHLHEKQNAIRHLNPNWFV